MKNLFKIFFLTSLYLNFISNKTQYGDQDSPDPTYQYKHSQVREFDRYLDYNMNIELDTIAILIGYRQEYFQDKDDLKQALTLLTQTKYFDEKEINIYFIDLDIFPQAIEDFKLKQDFQLVVLYNSAPHVMKDFIELWQKNKNEKNYEQINSKIKDYVRKVEHEITVELNSLKELQKVLDEEQMMAIYFGPKDHYWNLYTFFAQKHPERIFYHVFDRPLMHRVFRQYSDEEFPKNKHIFGILRSKNLLDEFDTQQLVYMHHLFSDTAMETFYDYEIFPKLRNDQYTDDNITQMYNNPREHIILYLMNDTPNQKNINEFVEAVKELPKKFIIAWISINSLKFYRYIELFQLAKREWQPEKVYILNVDKAKELHINEMKSEITKVNVNHFIFDFHKRKYYVEEERSSGEQLHNDEL